MAKKKRNAWQWFVRVIAGYEVMILCTLLLLVTVFFSTLEQAEVGLYTVKQKYYAIDVLFVRPELGEKILPVFVPGAYWVCVLFTINLISGGIIRMAALFVKRLDSPMSLEDKIIKFVGVFVAHFSMAVLMIAGAVDYHMSSTTMLSVEEGTTNNIGVSDEDVVIEVAEIVDGKAVNVHVIGNDEISDMILNGSGNTISSKSDTRVFTFDTFPFKIEFNGWYRHSLAVAEKFISKDEGPTVDGIFLREEDVLTAQESERILTFNQQVEPRRRKPSYNMAGAYIDVISDEGESRLVLHDAFSQMSTLNIGGKTYGFRICHRRAILPFEISLAKLDVNKYQGSLKARDYISHVNFKSEGEDTDASISMNQPLRRLGYVIYQARWSSLGADTDKREAYIKEREDAGKPLEFTDDIRFQSIYQVVKNPADKWPEYCIYVGGIALVFHFMIKLINFISTSFNRKERKQANEK